MRTVQRLYRRLRYGPPVVVVSGLPRSGTSMAMRMLEAAGLEIFTDGVRAPDEDNPRGYYEYERVKDLARDPDKSWLEGARGKVLKVISYLLQELPPTNNYRVLFMHRQLEEVIASQNKMLERRGEPKTTEDARMMELFQDHLWKVQQLLRHAAHFECLEVHYREVLADPPGQARRIAGFLGLPETAVSAMAEVVEQQLYRNRA